jgi:hypothetical protein
MSEKQRKSSERNSMPKVLLAAGLSAAALTGCANGEKAEPEPVPTSITLEASEMQELNDTVKELVMAGYEDMKNSVSPDEAADELTSGAYRNGSEATAFIFGTDIMDWRENDKNGDKRFRDDHLGIYVTSQDPGDYSQLSEGFSVVARRSVETKCLAYDPEDPTTAVYDEDRAGMCSDKDDNRITVSEIHFFNPDRGLLEQATADNEFTEEEFKDVLLDENTKLVHAMPAHLMNSVVIVGNEIKPKYPDERLDKEELVDDIKNAAATISDGWYH